MIVAKAVPQGIPGRRQLLLGLAHQQGASYEMPRNKLVLSHLLDIHMYRHPCFQRTQHPSVRSLLLRGD